MTTTVWTGGGGDNNFSNANNWNPKAVPAYGDITVPAGVTINVDGIYTGLDNLNLTGTGTVTLSTGALTLNDYINVGAGQNLILVNMALYTQSGVHNSGVITLNGSALISYNNPVTGVVYFDNVTNVQNLLYVNGDETSGTFQNFGPGDIIKVSDGNNVYLVSNGNGTYSMIDDHGNNYKSVISASVTLAPGVSPSDFTYSNGLFYYPCFLAGTMIRTIDGEVPVEDIRIGDEVISGADGGALTHRVVWVGHRQINLTACAEPELAGPVCVLANAIADGVPNRDLWLTPEHCLYLSGKLIPVRMLVNERSILSSRDTGKFDIYHIETETHSILIANNTLTESYLDTGNRKIFNAAQNSNVVYENFGKVKTWEHDAAAPLATAREIVEPIHRRLLARAVALGMRRQAPLPALTAEPYVHLATPSGKTYLPVRREGDALCFILPFGTPAVRLKSRIFRPSEVTGPFVDDRRKLGVLVGEITQYWGFDSAVIDAHLSSRPLDGWMKIDNPQARWTDGNAWLPLNVPREKGIAIMLKINIRAGGPYRLSQKDAAKIRRRVAGR